jgi:hypothetical protein
MTNDSKLIKEFNKRDVQRMRNIVSKKTNDKTTTQVGYNHTITERKEGEIWEENGKQWIFQNGIKQTLTKFDELKQLIILPLVCPKCDKPMSTSTSNKKLYSIHKMCLDCVIQFETELKRDGKYDEYQRKIKEDNVNGYLKDLENAFFDTFINGSTNSFVTEQGDIEQMMGGNIDKEKIIQQFREGIREIKEKMNM